MTLRITDVRCATCGTKLAEEIWIKSGGLVRFKCRGCKKELRFEDGQPATQAGQSNRQHPAGRVELT